jgi:hypothetical protein
MNSYTFKYLAISQSILWTGFFAHHITTDSHRYSHCDCIPNRVNLFINQIQKLSKLLK